MAHFAKVTNGIVEQVLVVPDEQEHRGQEYLGDELGLGGIWIQTSFNNRIRKRFAGIGYTYDDLNDVFIAPQPFPSWTLDENFDWQAPKPKPEGFYFWSEELGEWVNGETL